MDLFKKEQQAKALRGEIPFSDLYANEELTPEEAEFAALTEQEAEKNKPLFPSIPDLNPNLAISGPGMISSDPYEKTQFVSAGLSSDLKNRIQNAPNQTIPDQSIQKPLINPAKKPTDNVQNLPFDRSVTYPSDQAVADQEKLSQQSASSDKPIVQPDQSTIERLIQSNIEQQPKQNAEELSYEDEVKRAQQQGAFQAGISEISKGLANAGGAISRQAPSEDLMKALSFDEGKPLKDIQELQKARDIDTTRKQAKEKTDPNSDISKIARDVYKEYMNGKEPPEGFTYAMLEKFGGSLANIAATREAQKNRAEAREERRSERQESEDRRQKEQRVRFKDRIVKQVESFRKDKVVQKLNEQGLSFSQVDDLVSQINSGNEIALGSLGIKMAKAMGEVGQMTDDDVKRYIRAQSLVGKAKDAYGTNFYGKLSKDTIKDIKDVSKIMAKTAASEKNRLMSEYVNTTYKAYGEEFEMPREEIQKIFFEPVGDRGAVESNVSNIETQSSTTNKAPNADREKLLDAKAKEFAVRNNRSYDESRRIVDLRLKKIGK